MACPDLTKCIPTTLGRLVQKQLDVLKTLPEGETGSYDRGYFEGAHGVFFDNFDYLTVLRRQGYWSEERFEDAIEMLVTAAHNKNPNGDRKTVEEGYWWPHGGPIVMGSDWSILEDCKKWRSVAGRLLWDGPISEATTGPY